MHNNKIYLRDNHSINIYIIIWRNQNLCDFTELVCEQYCFIINC